jgi:DNA-directed RNA polymerase specialized sigma24 family protein
MLIASNFCGSGRSHGRRPVQAHRELAEIVRGMLAQVSPKSREVLALRYLAGYGTRGAAVIRP